MASRQLLVRLTAGVLLATLLACATVEAAGPWKGQIVDRDTGQPIPGAVVLAIWRTPIKGIQMHAETQFFDVDEVMSDAQGRIVIPERERFTWSQLARVMGPEIIIFKGG